MSCADKLHRIDDDYTREMLVIMSGHISWVTLGARPCPRHLQMQPLLSKSLQSEWLDEFPNERPGEILFPILGLNFPSCEMNCLNAMFPHRQVRCFKNIQTTLSSSVRTLLLFQSSSNSSTFSRKSHCGTVSFLNKGQYIQNLKASSRQ